MTDHPVKLLTEKELWRRNATDKRRGRPLTNITKSNDYPPYRPDFLKKLLSPQSDLSLKLLRSEE